MTVSINYYSIFSHSSTFFFVDIQIGFVRPAYSFEEPGYETLITNVTLVREGGRLSEQTFQVSISVINAINTPPAMLMRREQIIG